MAETETLPMRVSDIEWDHEKHTITLADVCIALTPTEYRLLLPLKYSAPVTYEQLAHLAYHYAVDNKVRIMMDKHIDRIRGKMKGTGIYIYCILGYGYVLLPDISCDVVAATKTTVPKNISKLSKRRR